MPNPELAALIANALQNGIMYPGDPERRIAPRPIMLPFKPSAGMPQEMADLMSETTRQLGEAIVHLIETTGDSEIVPKAQIRSLRHAAGAETARQPVMPVSCRHCDTTLMQLTVDDPASVRIDGRALLRNLRKLDAKCPHQAVKS